MEKKEKVLEIKWEPKIFDGKLKEMEGNSIFLVAPGVEITYLETFGATNWKRPTMVLLINEFTDFEAVHNHRKQLNRMRMEFEHAQGRDPSNPVDQGIYALYQFRKQGVGFSILAELLNYLSLAWIMRAHDLKKGRKTIK